jgi:hypothetical protein
MWSIYLKHCAEYVYSFNKLTWYLVLRDVYDSHNKQKLSTS